MANVFPIDIVAPGAYGLNTEKANTLLRPQWATKALNGVVNRSGRLAARRGWASQTTAAISGTPTIDIMFEYLNEAGTSTILSTANNKIYKNVTDFTDVANDITSSTAPTADYWKFVNFNGSVIGVQTGHNSIVWSGSGDFADQTIDSTGQPSTPDFGNTVLAAYGRLWVVDEDKQTIWYSVLLDPADFTTAGGAGYIDMSSIWTKGMDTIVAVEAVGATLVVFGKNHIIQFADRSGSEIGLDPTELEVIDTIEGTGCIARDSVQVTGEGDIIFLSRNGLQSLGRVIQNKNNPTKTITKNVRADFINAIETTRAADAAMKDVQSTHSPEEGLYIINFPTLDRQYVLDTRHPFEDDEGDIVFPVTDWVLGGSVAGMVTLVAGDVYFGSAGVVGKYSGRDDNGSAYDFEFLSGWLDFGDPQINHRLKMLKEIVASVKIGEGSVVWNWEFDFNGTQLTRTKTYEGGSTAEFNVAEFSDGGGAGIGYNDPGVGATSGETEFAGGAVIQRANLPAHGEGQFLRVGASCSVNNFDFVLQHMSISPKIGKMVT